MIAHVQLAYVSQYLVGPSKLKATTFIELGSGLNVVFPVENAGDNMVEQSFDFAGECQRIGFSFKHFLYIRLVARNIK
jgi:hypothetical protein